MTPIRIAFIATYLALGATTAIGQPRLKQPTTLEITVTPAEARGIRDKATGATYPLDGKQNLFVVSRDVSTTITILRTNPLLFEYAAKTVSEESPDHAAAVAFAATLQKLLANFPESAGAIQRASISGFAPLPLREKLLQFADKLKELPSNLKQSTGSDADLVSLKASVAVGRTLADEIDALYEAMQNVALQCLSDGNVSMSIDNRVPVDCDAPVVLELSLTLHDAERALTQARARVETARVELARATTALEVANQSKRVWDARKRRKPALNAQEVQAAALAEREIATISDRQRVLTAAAGLGESVVTEIEMTRNAAQDEIEKAQAKGQTLREFVTLAMAMDARVQQGLKLYREFAADADKVGGTYTAATHAYSVKDIQTTTITISSRPRWVSLMPPDVKAVQQAGVQSIPVTTDAWRPARVAPGAAFVLGFVRNPAFKAVKDGDTFKIVREDEELTRYDVAAMLNITPDAWRQPTFGGFFQLGVSPNKDNFGFYFGTGVQVQSVFTFGGGFMMQQVRRLANGLTTESRLTDPAELKTDSEFKPGFYLHVTVTLPSKK